MDSVDAANSALINESKKHAHLLLAQSAALTAEIYCSVTVYGEVF